jgi:hypothetical protein
MQISLPDLRITSADRSCIHFSGSLLLILLVLAVFTPFEQASADGRGIYVPPNVTVTTEEPELKPSWVVLPYAFPSESMGVAGGLAGGTSGYIQDQLKTFAAVLGSSNESAAGILAFYDLRMPVGNERFFLDVVGSVGRYTEQRAYIPDTVYYTGPRPGSNDSNSEDFIFEEGYDDYLNINFRFILPMGDGQFSGIQKYTLEEGLLVSGASGGKSWNPFKSGITSIGLEPFYRYQTFYHQKSGEDLVFATNGLSLALIHNNTDFPVNPSEGYAFRLEANQDFGWIDSTGSWTTVGGEIAGYLDLGNFSWTKQNVLAGHFWTKYAPNMDENVTPEDYTPDGTPPHYEQPSLGGFWRLRGYESYRFHDKAALLYTAEWRIIPKWQPLPKISWLKFFKIDWWQFVAFGELGRVARNMIWANCIAT